MNIHKTLIFVLCFTLLAIPIHADTSINAQPDTVCKEGYCKTIVDLSKYMTTATIDNVKASMLTTKDSLSASKTLSNISYKYDKNLMIFEGKVSENTYWTFDLKNGYVIDPWWNYSINVSTNKTWVNDMKEYITPIVETGSNLWYGGIILPNASIKIYGIMKNSSSGSTNCNVSKYSDHSAVATGTFSGVWCNFTSPPTLDADTLYVLVVGHSGNVVEYRTPSYPIHTAEDFDLIQSVRLDTWNNITWWIDIEQVVYEVDVLNEENIWYIDNLYLNGNETNITLDNATALNSSAITNLTGATVSIWINDTLSANGTDSVENVTLLPVGLYNVTAWFGNESTNETIIYWANMTNITPSIPSDSVIGAVYCIDNTTLGHINVTNLQTDNVITYYEYCNNGCDNVSMVCSPTLAVQNFYGFLIVIGFFVALAVILKYMRRF